MIRSPRRGDLRKKAADVELIVAGPVTVPAGNRE
jgi:hypothetical protein